MGFFSSLLNVGKALLPTAATLIGGPALGAATASAFGQDPPGQLRQERQRQITGATEAVVSGTATERQRLLAAEEGVLQPITAVDMPGLKNVTRTTVITRNPAGQVVKSETLKGRPFLMKSDLVIAKRVFKAVRKVHGKLPSRTRSKSDMVELQEAIVQEAKRKLLSPPPSCPPKC